MSISKGSVTLRLTNRLAAPRVVVLEPWTGEYTLHPGKAFDIIAEGDLNYPLEFELMDDRITVSVYSFDSAGATMTIFEDGRELTRSE